MRRRPSTWAAQTGRIGGAEYSLVDYNRGGTPLLEIVTAPDIRSAEEAKRFLQLLRQTIVELGISDAEMEKGTLRVDANVSVRPAGSDELRTRCEIKNMNSFNYIARGHRRRGRPADRDLGVGRRGQAGDVRLRRRLGHADAAPLEGGGGRLPLLPRARPRAGGAARRAGRAAARRGSRVALEPDRPACGRARPRAGARPRHGGLDALYEATVAAGADRDRGGERDREQPRRRGRRPGARRRRRAGSARRGPGADPARRCSTRRSRRPATPASRPTPYLARRPSPTPSELEPVIDAIIAANPGQAAAFKGGKEGLLGFFVGQVMKETGGSANPARRQRARAREAGSS